MGIDTLDCLDYQTIIHRIERVADHNATIAECLVELVESNVNIPKKVMKAVIRSSEIAFSSYDAAVQCFFSKDLEPTNDIIKQEDEVKDLFREVTPIPSFKGREKDSVWSDLVTIRERIKMISHYAADIAELTINRIYKSENVNLQTT